MSGSLSAQSELPTTPEQAMLLFLAARASLRPMTSAEMAGMGDHFVTDRPLTGQIGALCVFVDGSAVDFYQANLPHMDTRNFSCWVLRSAQS
jgi:hypothetical protein